MCDGFDHDVALIHNGFTQAENLGNSINGMEESRLIYLSKIVVENFIENILKIIKTEF